MYRLWVNKEIRTAVLQRDKNKFYVLDNMDYFLENVEFIMNKDYAVTTGDALRIYTKTIEMQPFAFSSFSTGYVDNKKIKETKYLIQDWSGHKDERYNIQLIMFIFINYLILCIQKKMV